MLAKTFLNMSLADLTNAVQDIIWKGGDDVGKVDVTRELQDQLPRGGSRVRVNVERTYPSIGQTPQSGCPGDRINSSSEGCF